MRDLYLNGKVELYAVCVTTFQTAKLSTSKQCCNAIRAFTPLNITNIPASSLLGSTGFSSRLRARPMVLSASTFSQSAPEGSTKKMVKFRI